MVLYLHGNWPTPKSLSKKNNDSMSSFFRYFLFGKWAARAAYMAVPTTLKLSCSSSMNSFKVCIAVFFLPVFGSINDSGSLSAPVAPPFLFFDVSIGGFVLISFLARPKSMRYMKCASFESLPMTTFAGLRSRWM